MEMVDEDTVAPRLADEDLEERFAELQHVLHIKDEAIAKAEELSNAKPGDEAYDDIMADVTGSDVDEKVQAVLDQLIKDWNEYIDKLDERESELFDTLVDHGYDMRSYYEDTLMKPMIAMAQNDPVERKLEQTVSQMLDVLRPVERKHGSSSERRAAGASSGYGGGGASADDLEDEGEEMDDDEELAHGVDVLDASMPLGEGDKVPDQANIYDDDDDAIGIEKPRAVEDTGAVWYEGYRVNASVQENLKEHQLELMCFLLDAWSADRGALGAHSMGLGKSLAFLTAFDIWSAKHAGARAVVAAPVSMVPVWAAEVDKWESLLPNVDAFDVVSKMDAQTVQRSVRNWKRRGGLFIIGHDHFARMMDDLELDDGCIFAVDEAHILKTPTTQLYHAFSKVSTNKRVFLTGTPLQNHLKEYYAMVQLLSPGLLGDTVMTFRKTYGRAIEQGMLKDSTEEQISNCEKAVQVLRWRMADVMNEKSPELLREHIPAKHEFRISHACDEVEENANPIVEYHNVQTAARTHKLIAAVSLIDCIRSIDPTDAILVFSNRVETLKAVQAVRDGLLFNGDLTPDRRSKMIDEFGDQGGVMYITTKAGGVGITLHRANHVIVLDPAWNPVDDAQAVARAWRMGQEKEVKVYRLIAEGTLEERIYRLGVQKHALAARILEEMDINRVYTREDLMSLTEHEECTPVDAAVLAKNPVLAAISSGGLGYTIYCHDALFVGNDASLTEEEEIEARNDLNGILAQQARMLTDPDGETQVVSVAQMYFKTADGEDTELVPAYTPSYSSIDGRTISFSNLGPSVFLEMQMRVVDKEKWIDPQREKNTTPLEIVVPCDGTFVFRSRSISDDFQVGPWSEESVPIRVST